jgi:N-acetylneuraminic acid mutarotase
MFIIACILSAIPSLAAPTDTHFTYQGRLKQGGLGYSGTADFTFTLFDAAAAGNQIGLTQFLTNSSLAEGLLTVDLDFGPNAFNGDGRWIEVAVRTPSGAGNFTTLIPRQPILPTPYALYALNASPVPAGAMILSLTPTPPPGYSYTGFQVAPTNLWTLGPTAPISGNIQNLYTMYNDQLYILPSGTTTLVRFDPPSNTWTSLAPPPVAVTSASFVALNSRIMLTNPSGPCYLYNPASNTWATIGPMLHQRITSAAQTDGNLYAFGGIYSGPTAISDMYNPATALWSNLAMMPAVRAYGSVTQIAGIFYYAGGADILNAPVSTLFSYDPVANSWSTLAPLPSPRTNHAAVVLNGKIYIFGGTTTSGAAAAGTDVYDPAADSWSHLSPPLNVPRTNLGGTAVSGNLLAIAGLSLPASAPSSIIEYLNAGAFAAPPSTFYVMIKN